MILSIGYQNYTLSEIQEVMKKYSIDFLVDVRSIPYSRKAEFNRGNLQKVLGKKYVYAGDVLGFKTDKPKSGAINLLAMAASCHNILLMCMEANPCKCHRYSDIGKRLLRRGIEVTHLDGNGKTTSELSGGSNGLNPD